MFSNQEKISYKFDEYSDVFLKMIELMEAWVSSKATRRKNDFRTKDLAHTIEGIDKKETIVEDREADEALKNEFEGRKGIVNGDFA